MSLFDPIDCPWNSLSQNTGVGSLSLLQGIFPTQGIKPRSALQVDSLPAKPQGKPKHTGMGSLSLLQQIFPTQELNQGVLHCRRIFFANWATKEAPQAWNQVHMSQFFHHNCDAEWVARPQSLQGKVCSEVGWRQGARQRSRERNWGQGQPTVSCGWWGSWRQVFPSYSRNGSGGWWGHTDLRLHCGGQRRDPQYILLPPPSIPPPLHLARTSTAPCQGRTTGTKGDERWDCIWTTAMTATVWSPPFGTSILPGSLCLIRRSVQRCHLPFHRAEASLTEEPPLAFRRPTCWVAGGSQR